MQALAASCEPVFAMTGKDALGLCSIPADCDQAYVRVRERGNVSP